MAVSVFRGGIRTPVHVLPGTKADWEGKGIPVGLNRLTQEGLAQMVRLGAMLGTYYGTLLRSPGADSPQVARVAVRATDHPWSMMSAQAVLRGMFPAKWVDDDSPLVFPIKINVDRDDLLLLAPRNCPLYQFDLAESMHTLHNPQWASLLKRADPLLQHFRFMYAQPPLTKDDITLQNWDLFYDPVECHRASNNLDTVPKNLSVAKMWDVLRIGDELERINYPANYGGLLGGNLLSHIIDLMHEAIRTFKEPERPWSVRPRLHLFAGHRETLSALLAALNQTVSAVPSFGDRVDLELVWVPSRKMHQVRVRQNGTASLRVCDTDVLCDFPHFASVMRAKLAQDWGLTCQRQDALACRQDEELALGDADDAITLILSPINGMWYLVSGAAGLLVLGVAVLVFWKWRRRSRTDDVPEEMPMQPPPRRGPKRFTLE